MLSQILSLISSRAVVDFMTSYLFDPMLFGNEKVPV